MWEIARLGDVCKIVSGNSIPAKKKEDLYSGSSGTPYVATKDVSFDGEINYDNGVAIPSEHLNNFKICKANSTLICAEGGSAGRKIAFSTVDCCYVNKLFALYPNEKIIPKYVYYWALSEPFQSQFRSSLQGLIGGVSLSKIKQFTFAFPPLAEQQRIVAKLDAAFAGIDKVVALSEKNIANAESLYAYAIDKAFTPFSDKANSIGTHSDISYGYTAKASFDKGSHKFLRITDIQDNAVDWEMVPYCDVEEKKLERVLLHDGDIVFTRTGATTGKSFLVENPANAVFASYLIRVSVNRDVLLPRYVMHFFQSASYWQQVNEGISGAAQGGFNSSKLAELHIPIISKEEQLNLVSSLDEIYRKSNLLAQIYVAKLECLNALKSAILTQELQREAA